MTTNKRTKIVAEPGKLDIRIEREFDAPRELVFKAMTDPALIAQWWGPRKYETIVDRLDARPGGGWRFLNKSSEGEFGFHGVFHDVLAPERVVQTFEFEGMPGHVAMETARFEERGGKTLLVTQSVFQSVEDRDGMIQSGMEGGLTESYERLDEKLKSMQAQKQPA